MPTSRMSVVIGLSVTVSVTVLATVLAAGCARREPSPGVGRPGADLPKASASQSALPSIPQDFIVETAITGMGDEWDLLIREGDLERARQHIAAGQPLDVTLTLSEGLGSLHMLQEAIGVWRLTLGGPVSACQYGKATIIAPPGQNPPGKPSVRLVPKDQALIVQTLDGGTPSRLGFRLEYKC